MSGLAGIFRRDGAPVSRDRIEALTRAVAHRGLDRSGIWMQGPIGLGHTMLETTPESQRETQPLVDPESGLTLVLDGRVDNRADLLRLLDADSSITVTDAALLLHAFRKWRDDFLTHVVGDFAFAIWDEREQTLTCGRDIMGVKPFVYYLSEHEFVFGSELHQLVSDPSIPTAVYEPMVAQMLAAAITDSEHTLYDGLLRLPPAHTLKITASGVDRRRYWDLSAVPSIRPRGGSYDEEFLSLFREAVRCRLRSLRPVGIYLSGGLDSSSIAVMAASLRESDPGLPPVETLSMVFPGRDCDESRYINAVLLETGLPGRSFPVTPPGEARYRAHAERYLDVTDYPNGAMGDSLDAWAAERGMRVLLTGLGGDEWLTGNAWLYADLLGSGRFLTFARLLTRALLFERNLNPLRNAFRYGIAPVLGGHFPPPGTRGPMPWLTDSMLGLLEAPRPGPAKSTPAGLLARADVFAQATWPSIVRGMELGERVSAASGLEQRHPFHDRRLIEFCLSLPPEEIWNGRWTKAILRRVMRSYLPAAVLQRVSKAEFAEVFAETLGALNFSNLEIVRRGWVRPDEIRKLCETMKIDYLSKRSRYKWHILPLWLVWAVELWYSTLMKNQRKPSI